MNWLRESIILLPDTIRYFLIYQFHWLALFSGLFATTCGIYGLKH